MKIKTILGGAARWITKKRRRSYLVGKYQIMLPPGHRLDEYQLAFLNYDRKLPVIAKLVNDKYPGAVTLDIGANVGDSAVAIRSVANGPILCVEGNPKFLSYLQDNLRSLPGTNRIIPQFIRPIEMGGMDFEVCTTEGTAHLLPKDISSLDQREIDAKNKNSTTTVREILNVNAELGVVKLLKSDTDGFDFAILLGALSSLALTQPVLFVEFDPLIGNSNPGVAVAAVEGLVSIGYQLVVIYDNYGNYIFSDKLTCGLAKDLIVNAVQRSRAGGGAVYFDLCCFAAEDRDLFQALVRYEYESAGQA